MGLLERFGYFLQGLLLSLESAKTRRQLRKERPCTHERQPGLPCAYPDCSEFVLFCGP